MISDFFPSVPWWLLSPFLFHSLSGLGVLLSRLVLFCNLWSNYRIHLEHIRSRPTVAFSWPVRSSMILMLLDCRKSSAHRCNSARSAWITVVSLLRFIGSIILVCCPYIPVRLLLLSSGHLYSSIILHSLGAFFQSSLIDNTTVYCLLNIFLGIMTSLDRICLEFFCQSLIFCPVHTV